MILFRISWGRLARGVGAFVLADLITGLAAFSLITLGGLWFFAFTWIRMASESTPLGTELGAPWQLDIAWLGLVVALPLMIATAYLALAAYRLPRRVWAGGIAVRPHGPSHALPSLAFLGGIPPPSLRRHR
ncbi:MAG: hypothetical protein L3K17_01510 [Thermoplasmata archaeon]|nr:hypothetical protein [Thermoplasmata archaeon]